MTLEQKINILQTAIEASLHRMDTAKKNRRVNSHASYGDPLIGRLMDVTDDFDLANRTMGEVERFLETSLSMVRDEK